MRPYLLSETSYRHVKDNPYDLAVLPFGATEPHNLHLPYGNDTLTVTRVAELACQRAWQAGARVCCLPTIPFGVNTNTLAFPMVISIKPTTQLALVRDVVDSMSSYGLRKLVLFNGHGGNELSAIQRELYGTEVFIVLINWYTVAADLASQIFQHSGEHADEMETSVALYFYPELVAPLDQADAGQVRPSRFQAINKGWASITRPWHLLTTNSGYGRPHAATAEKGKRFIDIAVERISQFLVELARAEMDQTFPY